MAKKTQLLTILGVLGLGVLAYALDTTLTAAHQRELAAMPIKERGAQLMKDVGCSDCHQPGSALRAPILVGIYGKTVKLADGSEVAIDDAYLLRSLVEPKAQVVFGYQAIMPSYQGRLSPDDLAAVVEALK